MFTFNIHGQADDLSLLEPLVRHLGHVEIAIDYALAIDDANVREHSRQPHPAVVMIDEIEREEAAKARQIKGVKTTYATKLAANAERKRQERLRMSVLSPKVIRAVGCASCGAHTNQPCRGPSGAEFGFTGHTHFARREAYKAVTS